MTAAPNAVAGIDTGGTFTDLIAWLDGRLVVRKVLSTPDDPGRAVLEVLGGDAGSRPLVVHGTTVATNALLERRGARVALITTRGFEDVIEIGRQARPEPYSLAPSRVSALVPRAARFGVSGPLAPDDVDWSVPTIDELEGLRERVEALGVDAVAIALLYSYIDGAAEERVASVFDTTPCVVSLSSRVLPVFREYERTSTTVTNAYVAPVMSGYLEKLRERAPELEFRVMASNAGSLDLETAAELPASCLLSGPAGGVIGAARVARALDVEACVTLDMGGTSTDVCLIDGEIPTSDSALVGGLPVAFPAVDIHTVGAGGGSLVRIDRAGVLRVGPESAGSRPGPIAYGRGNTPTITDANVLLGRLPIRVFERLQRVVDGGRDGAERILARIRASFEDLGTPLGVSPEVAADAATRSVEASMARALRVISTRRGRDPRDVALVCFGGAGGLHGVALAESLGMSRVIVPPFPGALSAFGLALADQRRDTLLSELRVLEASDTSEALASIAQPVVDAARREGEATGSTPEVVTFLALRYQGQSYEIEVPLVPEFRERFHAVHARRYGHSDSTRPIELVRLRVQATVRGAEFPLSRPEVTTVSGSAVSRSAGNDRPDHAMQTPTTDERAPVSVRDGRGVASVLGRVLSRDRVSTTAPIDGPIVVLEETATTWVPPGWGIRLGATRALLIERAGADR